MFPQNEGQSRTPAPIFVDRHGTHCAVGYLMRSDGLDHLVAQIVTQNNLVRVMEVQQGPLMWWLLTSGLTQEEAAMIQPGYPISLDATIHDFLTSDTTVTKHGVTLSGLTYKRAEVSVDSAAHPTTLGAADYAWQAGRAALVDSSRASLAAQGGVVLGTGDPWASEWRPPPPENTKRLSSWVYVGAKDTSDGHLLGGRNLADPTGTPS